MESEFNIGAATFGRTKTNNTGFSIFQKSGILQDFSNDELTIAFQLPTNLELFEDSEVYSVIRAKTTETKEELVAVSAYKYSGRDRDNRKTYYAATLCYSNKGFFPNPQLILSLLDELLIVSSNQQTHGIDKDSINLKRVLSLPCVPTIICDQIIKDAYFIIIDNQHKNNKEEFISISNNIRYSKYQKLFYSNNREIIDSTTLEKIHINVDTLKEELIGEYQKSQEKITAEYNALNTKYLFSVEDKNKLQLKLSQLEMEVVRLANEKKILVEKNEGLQNLANRLKLQLIQKMENNNFSFLSNLKNINVPAHIYYLLFSFAAVCSTFIISQLNIDMKIKIGIAFIPYFILLLVFWIKNKI